MTTRSPLVYGWYILTMASLPSNYSSSLKWFGLDCLRPELHDHTYVLPLISQLQSFVESLHFFAKTTFLFFTCSSHMIALAERNTRFHLSWSTTMVFISTLSLSTWARIKAHAHAPAIALQRAVTGKTEAGAAHIHLQS